MPHPLSGKRLSLLSVTEIRDILRETPPDDLTVEKLLRDPRAGVRSLARSTRGRMDRARRMEERYEEMRAFEESCRTEGVCCIAGLDEAGRGPLAGPVSVGCVVLPDAVRFAGLDDSKRMTPNAREEMYDRITAEARFWSVAVIDHLEIDEVGILNAVMNGMRQAVHALGMRPDLVLVDGNSLPGLPCRERAVVDGDALCLSIAAASVIAKVTRDRIMVKLDEQYPEYGFAGHKGYGCAEHVNALRRVGPCEIHRFSFHTAADVSPAGTVRAALERRLRIASTLGMLDRTANGIGRNNRFFSDRDLDYLRGVYRECLGQLQQSIRDDSSGRTEP